MRKTKKILYVVPDTAGGGIEKIVSEYADNFSSNYCDVDLLSFHKANSNGFGSISSFYSLGLRRTSIKKYDAALHKFFIEHNDYDVVHSNVHMYNGIVLKCAKHAGIKTCISHIHSNGGKCSSCLSLIYNKSKNIYLRYLINKYADYKIACSKKSGYIAYGNDKFIFVPNCINVNDYIYSPEKRHLVRKQLEIDDATIVFMHVGRFSAEKNHRFLLQVFAEYIKKHSDSCLLIFGGGSLEPNIKTDIELLSLQEHVRLMGYHNDLYNYYHVADIFILPSLFEGFPVSTIESQASGLKTVISDSITDEVMITDLVTKLSLKDTPFDWAQSLPVIFETSKRYSYNQKVMDAKFDWHDSIELLSQLYGF